MKLGIKMMPANLAAGFPIAPRKSDTVVDW